MSSPRESRRGPPELPGLMEASVWIMFWMTTVLEMPLSSRLVWETGLPMPETMPRVRVRSRPKGLPIASTFWPTRRRVESPKGITVSLMPLGGVNFMTARSFSGSVPITLAS